VKIFKVYREIFFDAASSISAHKLRSSLTILGIIIGIFSVVVMVSIGAGVKRDINNKFNSIGTNLILILPGSGKTRMLATGSRQSLTLTDVESIASVPYVKYISYQRSSSAQVIYNNINKNSVVNGISPEYFDTMNIAMAEGQNFSTQDYYQGNLTAIVGVNVAKDFFGSANPLGKVIHIANTPVQIIGIISPKGTGIGGVSQDDQIFIPYNTFVRRVMGTKFPNVVQMIAISCQSGDYTSYVEDTVTKLLRINHRLNGNQENDFDIRNLSEIIATANSVITMITLLLSAIAAISLVVGSIGIMNMMLVSVTERTKEIGIRKAIGSTDSNILFQFLCEAVMISLLGSIIGLLLGVATLYILSHFFSVSVQISYFAIALSIGVSVLVGLISGIFPAIKAAKLTPIDALRYE